MEMAAVQSPSSLAQENKGFFQSAKDVSWEKERELNSGKKDFQDTLGLRERRL